MHFTSDKKKLTAGRGLFRLDFRRSLVSGLRPSPGEERGLLSRTAAGDRV